MATQTVTFSQTGGYAPSLDVAAAALRTGGVVLFPTDTVYGIGVNATLPEAIERLQEAKSGSATMLLTIHLASGAHAARFVSAPGHLARRLSRRLWPGPVTLVLTEPTPEQTDFGRSCPPELLSRIYAGGQVWLRCPDHPAVRDLLRDAEVPVAASGASRAGEAPATDFASALEQFGNLVDVAIDAGRTRFGQGSTVVEVRDETWRVVREGVLDERRIARAAASLTLFVCSGNTCRSPMAEYLFRHALARQLSVTPARLAQLGFEVRSAGAQTYGGQRMSDGTREELAQRGIDGTSHLSQPLTVDLIQRADRVFCMTPEHRAAVLDLVEGGSARVELLDPASPVSDPIGGGPEAYRATAAQIEAAIARRTEELLHEDSHW